MIWVNMVMAYERLPEHIKTADRGPARPAQHRGDVRRRHADRKAPGPEGAVPRCRASGGTHPSGDRREDRLFVNGFTTHFTNFHTPQSVRFGQDFAPGAANLLGYLISQAVIPEYQVRWRLRKNSVAIWDNR